MNRLGRALPLVMLMGLTSTSAVAQSLEAIDKAEAALEESWNATPLSFRKVVLVDKASGFGIYEKHETSTYKLSEPVVVYAEPVGYGWKDNGDGTFSFGFDIDLLLKTPDGQIVAGQENFQNLRMTSNARNKEFMLTITLTLTGAPPGKYVIDYTTRDIASSKSGKISVPIELVQ